MFDGRSMPSTRALVLVALVVFAFWRPLLAGGTLAPDDQLWLSDPFNADPPADLTIEIAERDAATIHGWWVGWADDVRSGDLGWWRDVGNGEPSLGEGLPVTHLAYLFVPGWYAPGLVAALTVLLAAVGAMTLSDRRGHAPVAGLFAGIVFGFSGLMFAWIGWPHATAIALTPWVISGLLAMRESPSARRGITTALLLAAQLWCGVFAIAAVTVLGAVVWVAVDAVRARARTGLVPVAGAVGLGGLLAMPHLLPRWERWTWADTTHLENGGDSSAPLLGLITTVFGSGLGNESVGVAWLEASSFQLSIAFVGGAAMLAVAVAAIAGKPVWGAAALGGLGIALAYGGGPFDALADLVLGEGSLASHARVLVVLAVAYIGAAGIDAVVDPRPTVIDWRARLGHPMVRVGSSVLVVVVLIGLAAWLDLLRDASALRAVGAEALVTLGVITIATAALVTWTRQRLTGGALAVVLVALSAYELLAFGMPIPTVTDRSERPDASAAYDALAGVIGEHGRVAGDHDAFPPFASARFELHDVRSPGLRSPAEVSGFRTVDPASILGAVGGGPFEPVIRVRDDADPYRAAWWDRLGVDAWVLPRDASPPGPRVDPRPETRTTLAAASPVGTLTVPEHGLRAVVLDLRLPAFTPIALEVRAAGATVVTDVVPRAASDGPVAIPIAGEHLTPGAEATVVVTIDTLDDTAAAGTTNGALALGTIGGDTESELVWTDGALIIARPTARVAWDGPGSAEVDVIDEEAGRLRVEVAADNTGLLRSDVVAEPGWTATLDGRSVSTEAVDGVVMAVEVPAGTHTVEFAYRPPRLGLGLLLAAIGALLGGAWLAVDRRRGSPTS